MSTRFLTALPVYNEVEHIGGVLDAVVRYSDNVLVIDDGSTDGTSRLVAGRKDVHTITHGANRGYGAALKTAFDYAIAHKYDLVVTIDCDGQHEPQRIPQFVAACDDSNDGVDDEGTDIVSGSRYLERFAGDSSPPAQRRKINLQVTRELNRRLGLNLTDAFCGFKAYRVEALMKLNVTERGYAMPLELWVQAAHHGLRVIELPVPLIYLDERRSFGGALDDAATRLEYYHLILDRAFAAIQTPKGEFWTGTLCSEGVGRC